MGEEADADWEAGMCEAGADFMTDKEREANLAYLEKKGHARFNNLDWELWDKCMRNL